MLKFLKLGMLTYYKLNELHDFIMVLEKDLN